MTAPPLPFKLRCLYALTDALKTITKADGYHFDLADFTDDEGVAMERVFRGRAWFGDSDPIPMVSVLEAGDPFDTVAETETNSKSVMESDWTLNIQGFLVDDKTHPTDPGYLLLADIRRVLAREAARKGAMPHERNPLGLGLGKNKIVRLSFGSGTVRPADDVSAKTWLWLPATLRIVEHADDPYA